MTAKNSSDTKDREIITTRVINAPRERVWQAWTEPDRLIKWWGPKGFTNTFHEINIAPGGVWRFMMHGPDGTDYPNKIIFKEVKKPERLVYDHSDDGETELDHHFSSTVTFEDLGNGKTKLTMHAVFATREQYEEVKKFGAVEGGNQTLDRLEQHLASM